MWTIKLSAILHTLYVESVSYIAQKLYANLRQVNIRRNPTFLAGHP